MGAVLNNALTVPAGMYLRGASNIDTVNALQNILFIIIVNTSFIDKVTLWLFYVHSYPVEMDYNRIYYQQEKPTNCQCMKRVDIDGNYFHIHLQYYKANIRYRRIDICSIIMLLLEFRQTLTECHCWIL